ncbi:MAG TPA: peptidase S10 [Candidatus Binatia bacterium]|nr:peptidase S10 [Candidatus Binatia bacterium]
MMKVSWVLLVGFTLGLRAADAPRPDSARDKTNASPAAARAEAKKEDAKPPAGIIPDATHKPVLTTNTVTIAGQRVTYVAETGMLPLLKPDGTLRASVFYIAYTRQGPTNEPPRPVTFCFNGGPGSSAVWLQLGALGPRRVKMNEDGTLPQPPFGLVDNSYSILHVTDLVFIDPVATGFSRAAKDEKPEEFFGQSGDIESVGEFVRLWTSRHERWLSSKYLCGESYGVFRAAGLADHLHSRYGMYLNGLILVSGVLDFATLNEGPGNDLPPLIFLPAYTAIAHFHKKLPPDLQADLPKARAEAREFIRAEYPAALLQGAALPPAQRSNIVARLARLTGLSSQVIEDNDLRVDSSTFRKMLLHDQGLILGRYDARITGRDASPAARSPRFDPSYAAAYGPFAAAMNAYLHQELKFEDDLPYELLTGVQPWGFESRNNYPSVAGRLASVISENPYLRVLVLGSLCDLACPIDNLHYSVEHLQLDPAYRGNFTYAEYESGHMMYLNLPDLKKMQHDLEGFIRP